MAGPLALGAKFSLEGALQNGKVGPAQHRGAAWFSGVSRGWTLAGKTLDLSGEYKYASGTANPKDTSRDSTFDQLYAANHDRFGHEDLFGWRNLHDIRSLGTFDVLKNVSLNAM
jgi:Alginate export